MQTQFLLNLALLFIIQLTVAYLILPSQSFASDSFGMGLTYFAKNNHREADPYLRAAIQQHPEDANIRYYLALNLAKLGDRAGARRELAIILKHCPQSPAATLAKDALERLDGVDSPASIEYKPDRIYRRPKTQIAPPQTTISRTTTAGSSSPRSTIPRSTIPRSAFPRTSIPTKQAQATTETIYFGTEHDAIMVDALVNNKPLKMMIDSGSKDPAISQRDWLRLGFPLPAGKSSATVYSALGHEPQSVHTVQGNIKLGCIFKKAIAIDIVDTADFTPILGQSFFQDFIVAIDYDARCLRLSSAESSLSGQAFTWLPFKSETGKMKVDAFVNGIQLPMWLDTGNSTAAIVMGKDSLESLHLKVPEDATIDSANSISGRTAGYRFRVRQIKVGPIVADNAEIFVSEERTGLRPLIGLPLLEGWQYNIDYNHNRIGLLRRK